MTAVPCHTTSLPSLLTLPLQAWQRSTAQLPTHPLRQPSSPSIIIIPSVEDPCIFTEDARPFKCYSVVIPCPRSLSSSRFPTHHVILFNHCDPWRTYGKVRQRSNAKGPFWISHIFLGINLVTTALSIESFIHVPHRAVPWCNGQGNPTKSAPVNDIIKEVRKFEVRGEGCPSSAKQPLREKEFIESLQLLRPQAGFDCKCKHPTLQPTAAAHSHWAFG